MISLGFRLRQTIWHETFEDVVLDFMFILPSPTVHTIISFFKYITLQLLFNILKRKTNTPGQTSIASINLFNPNQGMKQCQIMLKSLWLLVIPQQPLWLNMLHRRIQFCTMPTKRGDSIQGNYAAATHPCDSTLQSPANLWLCCWLGVNDRHTDRGGPSVERLLLLLSRQRPGFKPICRTNGQSSQWPFPSWASARTVHCLKQGSCIQSDITINAAGGAAGLMSPERRSSQKGSMMLSKLVRNDMTHQFKSLLFPPIVDSSPVL